MIDCDPSSIIEASKCYCGLTNKEDSAVAIYLLCTWANQEGGPVTCGTPSDVIQISGAGNGDVNGIYVRNPILPNTYNSHDDAQAKIVVTAGNATIFYGFAGFERYYSTAEDFPCTWTLGLDGTLPVPTGQWLASPPVAWAPANEPVTWNDSGGAHVGDLPTFLATANFPSVSSLVFGATGNLTSLTGLKYLPSLATVNCNTNALTSLDCTNCLALTTLNCSSNTSLTTLTLTGCAALTTLNCSNCNITGTLDVSPTGISLITLLCTSNFNLTTLTLTGCSSMSTLDCSFCKLSSLILTTNISLVNLGCTDNIITELDLTGLNSLVSFDCSNNLIGTTGGLTVIGCTSLFTLACSNNKLTELDCTGLLVLDSIQCDTNLIGTTGPITITGCVSLTALDCLDNLLTSLNVSASNVMVVLICAKCHSLSSLNIGSSAGYSYLEIEDCILPAGPNGVDDVLNKLATNCLGNAGFCDLNTAATNASPTGGILNADYVALIGAGWTVNIN